MFGLKSSFPFVKTDPELGGKNEEVPRIINFFAWCISDTQKNNVVYFQQKDHTAVWTGYNINSANISI